MLEIVIGKSQWWYIAQWEKIILGTVDGVKSGVEFYYNTFKKRIFLFSEDICSWDSNNNKVTNLSLLYVQAVIFIQPQICPHSIPFYCFLFFSNHLRALMVSDAGHCDQSEFVSRVLQTSLISGTCVKCSWTQYETQSQAGDVGKIV